MKDKNWMVFGVALMISYAITWAATLWIYRNQQYMEASYFLAVWLLTWIPGCIGIIAAKLEGIKISFFGEPNRLLWIAFLVGWIIAVCAHDGHQPYTLSWIIQVVILYPLLSLLVGGIRAFAESIFWWGYLYQKLANINPFTTFLIIGLTWGLWYAPMILFSLETPYEDYPFRGLIMMPLLTTLLSPLMFYFRHKGACILPPSILLATLQFSTAARTHTNSPYDDFIDGVAGIKGMTILLICAAIALLRLWRQGAFKKSIKA